MALATRPNRQYEREAGCWPPNLHVPRDSAFGREAQFFKGLLLGCEIVLYVTAVSYLGGYALWGNPNSLGAVMSVAVFPVLLWAWFTSDPGAVRWRRLASLLLCFYLVFFSLERAGMAAVAAVTMAFCLFLGQYKMLLKVAVLGIALAAAIGIASPDTLNRKAESLQNAVLYKGKTQEGGLLGSRRSAWEKTISNVKQHPWLGSGYGTSLTDERAPVGSGNYSSTGETAREHGSSYLTIIEWVGFVGIIPFVLMVALNTFHILRVGLQMRRTGSASHYSVPLAMVLIAGFVHAGFEDWMFAVGYYLCVYFWTLAFVLTDLLPVSSKVPLPRLVSPYLRPSVIDTGTVAHGR